MEGVWENTLIQDIFPTNVFVLFNCYYYYYYYIPLENKSKWDIKDLLFCSISDVTRLALTVINTDSKIL